jgi:hypothetical protein
MPRPKPSGHPDFGRILDARARVAERAADEPAARVGDAAAPGVHMHEMLCGMQECRSGTSDGPGPELAQLYDHEERQYMAPPEIVQESAVDMVASELRLTRHLTRADLNRMRRDFALANHPDRVGPPLRERATRRMMIANTLIDQALKQTRNQSG